MKEIEVCSCTEYLRQAIDAEVWAHEHEADEVADSYAAQLHVELESRGFLTECAKGERVLYHGWNGFNLWEFKDSEVGSFEVMTDHDQRVIRQAQCAALNAVKRQYSVVQVTLVGVIDRLAIQEVSHSVDIDSGQVFLLGWPDTNELLEDLFENMQASGSEEEWKQSLKFLTDQWLAEIEFFSRAGPLGERQGIPDRDSRDRLETLARVHDTITATLERLEA